MTMSLQDIDNGYRDEEDALVIARLKGLIDALAEQQAVVHRLISLFYSRRHAAFADAEAARHRAEAAKQ
jgi:hypothetical protein